MLSWEMLVLLWYISRHLWQSRHARGKILRFGRARYFFSGTAEKGNGITWPPCLRLSFAVCVLFNHLNIFDGKRWMQNSNSYKTNKWKSFPISIAISFDYFLIKIKITRKKKFLLLQIIFTCAHFECENFHLFHSQSIVLLRNGFSWFFFFYFFVLNKHVYPEYLHIYFERRRRRRGRKNSTSSSSSNPVTYYVCNLNIMIVLNVFLFFLCSLFWNW